MSSAPGLGLSLITKFVLIPGAGGAAWYWHRVVPELEARGHDALAVDLPADDDRAGLAEYAETVVDAIGPNLTDLVLVAQSMGAFTAPLVADRLAVRLLVLLNAMVPTPGESAGAWWANTGQEAAMQDHAQRIGLGAVSLDDVETLFGHDVPPDVFAAGAGYQRDQSATPFGEPWPLAAWPSVPTRVLAARDDRLFPLEFQQRAARERLGIDPDEIDGGHLVALSRPAELADRLVAYAREVTRGP